MLEKGSKERDDDNRGEQWDELGKVGVTIDIFLLKFFFGPGNLAFAIIWFIPLVFFLYVYSVINKICLQKRSRPNLWKFECKFLLCI